MKKIIAKLSLFSTLLVLPLVFIAPRADAGFSDIVHLGAANYFTALALTGDFTMSGPLGPNGPYSIAKNVGVVSSDAKFDASGSTSISGELFLHTGTIFQSSAPGIPDPQPQNAANDAFLEQAAGDAIAASAFASSLPPTASYGTISETTVIAETTVGVYVLDIEGINFSGNKTLTLSAPKGSVFIINLSDQLVLTGGSILIAGGLTSTDVLINYTGTDTIRFSGGGNSSQVFAAILAPNADIALSPGLVTGGLYADSITMSSGAQVCMGRYRPK